MRYEDVGWDIRTSHSMCRVCCVLRQYKLRYTTLPLLSRMIFSHDGVNKEILEVTKETSTNRGFSTLLLQTIA